MGVVYRCATALSALAIAGAAVAATTSRSAVAPGSSWLAYGRTAAAGNAAAAVDGLTPAALAHPKLKWRTDLSGSVTAEPLYAAAIQTTTGPRPLLFVATGAGLVYALDARTGKVVWSHSLGQPLTNICGGKNGIASTPVIDLGRHLIYAIGDSGKLHALSLATGFEAKGWPVDVVQRTSVEYVWGALRLVGGRIYVPVANSCDQADAQGVYPDGRVVAVDETSRRVVYSLDVVPGPDNGGGVWALGGVSVDPTDGTLYVGTSNAFATVNGQIVQDVPNAERVLRLTPSLRVLGAEGQTFTMSSDDGFGSTPVLFQPAGCPPLAAANSKNGATYVWQRGAAFGKSGIAPVLIAHVGQVSGAEFVSQPTYVAATRTLVIATGEATVGGSVVDGPIGFRVGAGCTFTQAWVAPLGGGTATQPLAIGDVVLSLSPTDGTLGIIDTRTGSLLSKLAIGPAYAPPIAVDGVIYDATAAGTVAAYTAGG